MAVHAPPSVRLLVCGNADRGDDGAAPAAVASLLAALPVSVLECLEVVHCGQLGVDDLMSVPAGQACLVVDAATGITPGEVVTLPIAAIRAGPDAPTPRSSHGLAIDQVLGLAGALRPDGLPRGTIVCIGGRSFGYGQSLSPSVWRNMAAFQAAIVAAMATLAWDGCPPDG